MSKSDTKSIVNAKVVNGIAIVVTMVWAASFIADIFLVKYNPPSQIHAAMLIVVGSLFGFQITSKKGDSDDQ